MSKEECPVYGTGWDTKVAECIDCEKDYPEEYEECQRLTATKKQNGAEKPEVDETPAKKPVATKSVGAKPVATKATPAKENGKGSAAKSVTTKENGKGEATKPAPVEKSATAELVGKVTSGRKERVKSSVGKMTKEMILADKGKDEIVAALKVEYLKDQTDEKYALKMARFIYHRVLRELGMAKPRGKKAQEKQEEDTQSDEVLEESQEEVQDESQEEVQDESEEEADQSTEDK
jgi:hypothetical protein